ncbi:olfactory receptor 52B2-like [Megalops cyprinoides]|uniref:olfactory receptor 52B2-like n=1 Tax=Megalops cyprinoides TaxID=118141 RepID=UPI0018645FCB|nr:olfactory receptor 52B2-like [Megalops cyprinoides]
MDTFSSNSSSVLRLQGFDLSPQAAYVAFVLATLCYLSIVFCNLVLLITITINKSLHQPMYLLLFNLPINDLIGSTAILPHLIKEILLDSRYIKVSDCIAQAFFLHIYGVGSVVILTIMSYDRYIAICNPLRYNTIMTSSLVVRMITMLWLLDFFMIGALFALVLRWPRCQSLITQPYCDNPSLVNLVCADTTINNIYGLFITASLQVFSVSVVVYTYLQILIACFKSKGSDTKTKALQTCATHLTVFLILESLGFLAIISYRMKEFSLHVRRFVGVSIMIFPPFLNPIIYGLKTKEIKQKIMLLFCQKVVKS